MSLAAYASETNNRKLNEDLTTVKLAKKMSTTCWFRKKLTKRPLYILLLVKLDCVLLP